MKAKHYPVSCPYCKENLYGPTAYCPFCGKKLEKSLPADPDIDLHKKRTTHNPPTETKSTIQPAIPPEQFTDKNQEVNDNETDPQETVSKPKTSESDEGVLEQEKQPLRQEPLITPAKASKPAHELNQNLIILILGIIAIIGATGFIFLQVKKAEQETIAIEAKSETAAAEAKAEKEWLKIEAQKRKDDENERLDSLRKAKEEKQLIYNYLSEGKSHYNKGEYKLAIMSMKEVIRRDDTNREAERFIQLASKELDRIKKEFEYPETGTPR